MDDVQIYDVVNILESVQLVLKKGKNTYTWLGGVGKKEVHFIEVFGQIQEQGILEAGYAEDAKKNGLVVDQSQSSCNGTNSSGTNEATKGEARSLSKLSAQFLQVFLMGYQTLSLPTLSEKIQGTLSAEDYAAIGSANSDTGNTDLGKNPGEFRRAAARGLKTKIRRLYDIANVFLAGMLFWMLIWSIFSR